MSSLPQKCLYSVRLKLTPVPSTPYYKNTHVHAHKHLALAFAAAIFISVLENYTYRPKYQSCRQLP